MSMTQQMTARQDQDPCGMVMGSFVGLDGVARAKTVPRSRERVFVESGMGASPTWAVFCPDSQIAFTDDLGVVGDWRLRIDPAMERRLDGDVMWAPTDLVSQEGSPLPYCPRSLLRDIVRRAADEGFEARFGFEFEFYLLDGDHADLPDGNPLRDVRWQAYGAESFVERGEFFDRVCRMCEDSGVPLEQVHCEYDRCQLEVSTAPDSPLRAADTAVLTKLVIHQAARRSGLAVSFSPKPFVDLTGNGGHVHFSLTRITDGSPILSGGLGAYGLTEEGEHAIAGIHAHLRELTAFYAGSPVSQLRLSPDSWSGAAACWGLENREAAIRFCSSTAGNPSGANIEVKCADLSANPYYVATCILGSALDGMSGQLPLLPETEVDPVLLSEQERKTRGVERLPSDYETVTETLASSRFAKSLLGAEVVDADLAIRRLMSSTYGAYAPEELALKFRHAW